MQVKCDKIAKIQACSGPDVAIKNEWGIRLLPYLCSFGDATAFEILPKK